MITAYGIFESVQAQDQSGSYCLFSYSSVSHYESFFLCAVNALQLRNPFKICFFYNNIYVCGVDHEQDSSVCLVGWSLRTQLIQRRQRI